jgi:hypothetical protein
MILKFDLSNLDAIEDVRRVIEYCRSIIEKMPPKSIVGLVDLNGLKVADEMTQEMILLTESCDPYVRATAVLANDPESVRLAKAVSTHLGGIDLPIYQEEEAAKEWLFSQ